MLEAMSTVEMPFFRNPTAPVRPWLHGKLRRLADELMVPAIAAITTTLVRDPGMGDRREASVDAFTSQLSAAIDLAVATGELTRARDSRDAAAILVGPILYRTTMQGHTVADPLIDHLLDSIGTWLTPGGCP